MKFYNRSPTYLCDCFEIILRTIPFLYGVPKRHKFNSASIRRNASILVKLESLFSENKKSLKQRKYGVPKRHVV